MRLKPRPPGYWLYHLAWSSIDLLYPPFCGGCQALGERWCHGCQDSCTVIGNHICQCCGQVGLFKGNICPDCQNNKRYFTALRTWAVFKGPVREALHRLKYRRDVGLGEALSQHLIDLYENQQWKVDLVTCVPLSAQRKKARGYNQASLLARPLAYAIRKPYMPDLLIRTRDTRSQVGLKVDERRENVRGAFDASNSGLVHGKIILVVDDVTTTGATIDSCSLALHQAGAKEVYAMTLARAVLRS